jgi:CO/xanthine dehydrogenase Mo-binding subunit
MWYRHEADGDGKLARVEARIVLDGGAYLSTSRAVIANASYFAVGPYRCDSVLVDGTVVRTNNPPNGAMRGFGAVQVCFAYEAQMDRLASVLGIDSAELRLRNALRAGEANPTTGQMIPEPFPTEQIIRTLMRMPLPPSGSSSDDFETVDDIALSRRPSRVHRGTGYALGFKNLGYSEGFDDFTDARVVLSESGAEVHTAASDMGQGLEVALVQIARTALGMENVRVVFCDTSLIGSAGSSSASRQTQMSGNAVYRAARVVREKALEVGGGDDMSDEGVFLDGVLVLPLDELCRNGPIEATERFRYPPTERANESGQGNVHAGFVVAGHRATVDVDLELGVIRIVQIDTAQDVGRVVNPKAVIGQIEGGIAQGIGLALMEELLLESGMILNSNLGQYLVPTVRDVGPVRAELIESPGAWGPLGVKGVGEPPTVSSTAAVAAAIRAATGKLLTRVPIRPEDVVSTELEWMDD